MEVDFFLKTVSLASEIVVVIFAENHWVVELDVVLWIKFEFDSVGVQFILLTEFFAIFLFLPFFDVSFLLSQNA